MMLKFLVLFLVVRMSCEKCSKKGVISLQHGNLCKNHFINYFEDKVFKTINKFNLINRKKNICVAASGGKDSLTVLYLTKKYLEKNNIPTTNLFALVIDEGINDYRENTIKDLELFCKKHNVTLKKVILKEKFGFSLDQTQKLSRNKNQCNICGVWRRYLLNKYARKEGAELQVTGHNLDDESQAIIMNIFKANTKIAGRLGPRSGIEYHKDFVQRVKPLYFCSDKEVRLYTLLKGFKVNYSECPYSKEGYRFHIQEMLNNFENKYKGTKQGIVNSFLALQAHLQDEHTNKTIIIKKCLRCEEPSNKKVCNACIIMENLQNER